MSQKSNSIVSLERGLSEDEEPKLALPNLTDLEDPLIKEYSDQKGITYQWENINFFVPVKKSAEKRALEQMKLSELMEDDVCREQLRESLKFDDYESKTKHNFVTLNNNLYHQILKDATGYVKSGEMVAIMGPSGSGKTSLLNILSMRTNVSRNCKFEGSIQANKQSVKKTTFQQFGSFVQQDDILMITMTPQELMEFSATLTSNETKEQVKERVAEILKRLGLTHCKDTYVGGYFMKGLSGGERKRTSIGYELITNPSLLLLDEPTSGLDSNTALQIVRLLKSEAKRGMGVLATIHSPSAQIFENFDRVILLSDGFTIYNGPVNRIPFYLQSLSIQMPSYTNPADFIIKMAIDPNLVSSGYLTVRRLAARSQENYVKSLNQNNRKMTDENTGNINNFAEWRKQPYWKQFKTQVPRMANYVIRNPRGIFLLMVMAAFMAFLEASTFYKAGSYEISLLDISQSFSVIQGWVGVAFFCAIDCFYAMAMAQVLQIPVIKPLYEREYQSGLYTPSSYFYSTLSATIPFLMVYPVIVFIISFWCFDIVDQSFANVIGWLGTMFLEAFCGAFFGFAIGSWVGSPENAILITTLIVLVYDSTAGIVVNLNSGNEIVNFLSYFSPMRYSLEIFLRRILSGQDSQEVVLAFFGYSLGYLKCYMALIGWSVFYLLVGWSGLVFRSWRL